jgi:hypothetical protein
MSTDPTGARGGQPSEEELRAAYEAEIKKLRVEQVLLENIISLVNLGMRRTGLSPGTEDERDTAQVRLAIEAVRALTPLLDQAAPAQAKAIKDALSQLQLAFVRIGGSAPAPGQEAGAAAGSGSSAPAGGRATGSGKPEPEPPKPGEPGPAQRSGRLWVPGQ